MDLSPIGRDLLYEWEEHDQPLVTTLVYGRDYRPDLKQLVHSLLCIDHGILIQSRLLNGESDKTINRNLIDKMLDVWHLPLYYFMI